MKWRDLTRDQIARLKELAEEARSSRTQKWERCGEPAIMEVYNDGFSDGVKAALTCKPYVPRDLDELAEAEADKHL
jgi:hypothetical protein